MQKGLVSIIMPVYNEEKKIINSVSSILKQSYGNFELIIVNDGSTDNTKMVLENLQKKDSRIKVFEQKNSGCAASRNAGLKLINGEYVTFIDSDDYILSNHLEMLVKAIQKSDLGIINFKRIKKLKKSFNEKKYLNKKINGIEVSKENFYKALFSYPTMGGGLTWNKIYKAELLKDIYFNPNYRYHEDINFVLQYSLKCKKFYYIKNITYFYIYNPKSMTSQKYFSEKRFSGLQVMKDNNEIAEKISPIVLSYSKAWQFLVNIEILFALKKFKVNNKEVHDDIINTLKETYPHFKKNKKNFNLFRRLGGVAYKIMLMFKF